MGVQLGLVIGKTKRFRISLIRIVVFSLLFRFIVTSFTKRKYLFSLVLILTRVNMYTAIRNFDFKSSVKMGHILEVSVVPNKVSTC